MKLAHAKGKKYQFHYSWDPKKRWPQSPNIVWEVEILFIYLLVFLLLGLLVDVVFPSCDSFLFLIFYFHLFFHDYSFLSLFFKKNPFSLPPPFLQLSFFYSLFLVLFHIFFFLVCLCRHYVEVATNIATFFLFVFANWCSILHCV